MSENSNLPSDCLFLTGCDANGGLIGYSAGTTFGCIEYVAAMFVTFKNSSQLNVLRFFLFCN